jgi:hypothetical protein
LVEVGEHSIRFRAITPDGQYVDSFDIERRDDGTNRVVEKGQGGQAAPKPTTDSGKGSKIGQLGVGSGDKQTVGSPSESLAGQVPTSLMAALAMISLGGILAGVSYWKK